MEQTTRTVSTVIRSLAVTNFRNLEPARLLLPEEGVVLIGRNGQGKTNVLEALYYLHLLRSFRGSADSDVTCFGADHFHLGAETDGTPRGAREISIGFERHTRRKRILVNGSKPERMSDAYGAVPAVMCSPDDREMIAGAPAARRRFLDIMLSTVSPQYLFALQQYRQALLQRNAAIRTLARGGGDAGALAVWEPALAAHGAALTSARVRWVVEAAPEFARLCDAIGEREAAGIQYVSRTAGADAREALAHRLETGRAGDIKRGVTQAGPHREEIRLELAGRELREFGSAGQQRTAALALRMLEAATMRRALDTDPLLLLDDPFAELDRERASRILTLLRATDAGQAVLCVPREDDVPRELSYLPQWGIERGRIAPPAAGHA